MHRDRIEELLLVLIAACMLSFLLPFSLVRNILVMLLMAIGLIALLILRSFSWHEQRATPYDGVLVLGVLLSIAYLASFGAFQQTALTPVVILLFAFYYALMAYLLYEHRWLFRRAEQAAPNRTRRTRAMEPLPVVRMPKPGKIHDDRFMEGLEPIPDVTAEHLHKLGVYDSEEKAKRRPI